MMVVGFMLLYISYTELEISSPLPLGEEQGEGLCVYMYSLSFRNSI